MKKALAALMALMMILSLTACGAKGEDVTGKYIAVSATSYGEDSTEYLNGEWIELKKGGKGTYYSGYEFDLKWELNGETFTGTVSFMALEEDCSGTLKDGVLTVTYGDWTYVMVKEGVTLDTEAGQSAGGNGNTSASEAYVPSDFFENASVASTMDDAFAGATSSGSGFVSETTSFEIGSRWYGTMALTNFVGTDNEDTYLDAYGVFGEPNPNETFFEIFLTENHSDSPALSHYIDLHDDYYVPVIGDEDAWIIDTYLTADDTEQLTTYLYNGAIVITYPYHETNSDFSCDVMFYLREEGAEWDEDYDLLPPGYDDYKAKFGL